MIDAKRLSMTVGDAMFTQRAYAQQERLPFELLADHWPHGAIARAYGVFDDARLIGTAILEGKFIGANKDRLQLEFLHVSRAYRKTGLGTKLFNLAREVARQPRPLGAVGRDGGEAQDMLRRRRGGNGCERRERDERAGECAQHGHRVAAWPV